MSFTFNEERATQAAAVILTNSPNKRVPYIKLLKLLYEADKESLKQSFSPITGDKWVAMDKGPVLSCVLNLIREPGRSAPDSPWQKHIKKVGILKHDVELVEDPGCGKLSPFEVEILKRLAIENEHVDKWDKVEETHKFPEWSKNHIAGTSRPIPLKDILDSIGRGDEYEDFLQEQKDSEFAEKIFG